MSLENNKISDRQNQPDQLMQLAAQRQLYADAKRVFGGYLFLATILPCLLLPVVWFWYPALKIYLSISGWVLTQIDLFWLSPWQEHLREQAAKIQEQFDCIVLQLPGNDKKIGGQANWEDIRKNSRRYETWADRMGPLQDWYCADADKVPVEIGRIACQRANIWWDAQLRRRVATLMVVSVIVLVLVILVWALVQQKTVPEVFMDMLLPLWPLINFCLRQRLDQTKAADRLDRLRADAEKIWKSALQGAAPADLTQQSRALQDEIYDHRRKVIPVPDFIYAMTHKAHEEEMNFGVKQLIEEALQALQRKA